MSKKIILKISIISENNINKVIECVDANSTILDFKKQEDYNIIDTITTNDFFILKDILKFSEIFNNNDQIFAFTKDFVEKYKNNFEYGYKLIKHLLYQGDMGTIKRTSIKPLNTIEKKKNNSNNMNKKMKQNTNSITKSDDAKKVSVKKEIILNTIDEKNVENKLKDDKKFELPKLEKNQKQETEETKFTKPKKSKKKNDVDLFDE